MNVNEGEIIMIRNFLYDNINKFCQSNRKREYIEIKSIVSKNHLEKFHQKYMKKILLHLYKNVPYYLPFLEEEKIVYNNDKIDLSKFNQLPILTKEIMRKNHEELISTDYRTRKWYYNSSGGSTGEPIRFIQDNIYSKWENARNYYYFKDILNVDIGRIKKIVLWGSERDLLKGSVGIKAKISNWLTNTMFLNSFKMTGNDIDEYINIINAYEPELIRGYAGSLYELCNYLEKKIKEVHTPRILLAQAETVTDEMKEKIERVFKTKLYNFYGSREVAGIAGECKEGLMHIFSFHNYVEILDDNNQPVKDGEEGRVIVTNLHNYSMPFIRYDIGDRAILGPEKCKCGNILPTLKKVTGRVTDHFVSENGSIISGSALTLTFNLMDWVKAFQIIQEDYKKIKILIVTENDKNDLMMAEVEKKIKFLLGKDCEINWEFVQHIPKTKSGKYLYIKSLINR